MRTTSVKFNGREVHNPVLRTLIVVFLLLWAMIAIPLGFLLLFSAIPLMFALDLPLKALGRRGCIEGTSWHLDRDSFRKRRY